MQGVSGDIYNKMFNSGKYEVRQIQLNIIKLIIIINKKYIL